MITLLVPNMKKEDIYLLEKFIEREAMDYTPRKNEVWMKEVRNKILAEIGKEAIIKTLQINSTTNLGVCIRRLQIDINKNITEDASLDNLIADFKLTLCPCGSLEHILI